MDQQNKLPQHVAIIPDGNRRWARKHKLAAVWEGHREGARRFREVCEVTFRQGIPYLTIWAASEDNFVKRSPAEVEYFLNLFEEELERLLAWDTLEKNEMRVRVIGKWREMIKNKGRERLPKLIEELENKTRGYDKRHLTILFGYDGKREMLEAIESLPRQKGLLTQDSVKQKLWTADLPLVDLVVRTGGEPHWSAGFMMWHTADAQLYFTETLFPDFGVPEFEQALADYTRRERRFGK